MWGCGGEWWGGVKVGSRRASCWAAPSLNSVSIPSSHRGARWQPCHCDFQISQSHSCSPSLERAFESCACALAMQGTPACRSDMNTITHYVWPGILLSEPSHQGDGTWPDLCGNAHWLWCWIFKNLFCRVL